MSISEPLGTPKREKVTPLHSVKKGHNPTRTSAKSTLTPIQTPTFNNESPAFLIYKRIIANKNLGTSYLHNTFKREVENENAKIQLSHDLLK